MLTLTRKLKQSVMIGDIEVKVMAIRGDTIRLGVEAPPGVPIRRGELPPEKPCTATSGGGVH